MSDCIPRRAVYAGSFDPITLGHLDVIRRGAKLFDEVVVAVGINTSKATLFSLDERLDMIETSIAEFPNVSCATFSGLLIQFAKEQKASAIIRGLRAVTDFDYEFQIGLANMDMNPDIETIFLLTSPGNIFISSSIVKEIARFGGDVSSYLPPAAVTRITRKLGNKP